jgi:hypothetical protein
MIARYGTAAAAVVFCFAAVAQSDKPTPRIPADTPNAACVERLEMPTYPLLARQARLAGTLSVTVTLGPGATVENITTKADLNNNTAQGVFFTPLKNTILKGRFREDCAGKQVTLIFEFRISGDPSDRQQQEAAFGFPNRFWITARPIHYQP